MTKKITAEAQRRRVFLLDKCLAEPLCFAQGSFNRSIIKNRRTSYLIASLFLFSTSVFSQNIFDYQHNITYANYLFKSRQYDLAAQEYERALFLAPHNDTIAAQLIKTYNLSGQCKQAKLRVKQLALNNDSMPDIVAKEYVRTLFCNNLNGDVRNFLSSTKLLNASSRAEYSLYLELSSQNFKKADSILNTNKDSTVSLVLLKYKDVVYNANHLQHRSPGLALCMSAIVPGTGKIYAGSWKDGLMSIVFVGATAFQAYRGFSEKGVKSIYGWIYGGISTGFYLGNLYGSYKAAKKYNSKKVHKVLIDAEKIYNAQ